MLIVFLSLENTKLGTLFTVLVSVGRKLLATATRTCTAGWTVPSCQAIYRSFRLLYIPSSTYTGNFWCLCFSANLYAKKRKLLNYNLKVTGRPPPIELQLQNSLEYSLLFVLKIFTVLHQFIFYCFCALFSVEYK